MRVLFVLLSSAMRRLALYLTDAEFSEVKRQAGDVPLSKWCRLRIRQFMHFTSPKETLESDTTSGVRQDAGIHPAGGREFLPSGIRDVLDVVGTCRHGNVLGGPCWQCGGTAVTGIDR